MGRHLDLVRVALAVATSRKHSDPLRAAELIQELSTLIAEKFGTPLQCCIFSKYLDFLHADTSIELSDILIRKLVEQGASKRHLDIKLMSLSEQAEHLVIEYLDREDNGDNPQH